MARPIPAGHRSITPHPVIKGAAEAIEFYKRAFGATELARMPFPAPDGRVKLGHAELQVGDSRLFLWPTSSPSTAPSAQMHLRP